MGYARDQFRKCALAVMAATALVAGIDGLSKMTQPEGGQMNGSVVDVVTGSKPWATNPEYIERVKAAEDAYNARMQQMLKLGDSFETITAHKLQDEYGRAVDGASRKSLHEHAVRQVSQMQSLTRVEAFKQRLVLEKGMQQLDMQFAEKTLPPTALAAYKAGQALFGESLDQKEFTAPEIRDFLLASYKNARERANLTGIEKPDAKMFTITHNDFIDAMPGLRKVMDQQPEVKKNILQRIKPLV